MSKSQRMLKVILVSVLLELCLAPWQASALLQNTVRGVVADLKGNPLPGARCVFTQLEQNVKITVTSAEGGRFIRSGMPSGRYRSTDVS